MPHVFVRPGELRLAEWSEFDLDKAVWTIPAHATEMRRAHSVPLSRQVLTIIASIENDARLSPLLFPSLRSATRLMSENTINAALRRLGYAQDEMTGHGFRAVASTLLNSMGKWNPDAIERQLAHVEGHAVRRASTRGEYWNERVDRGKMAQYIVPFYLALKLSIKITRPLLRQLTITKIGEKHHVTAHQSLNSLLFLT